MLSFYKKRQTLSHIPELFINRLKVRPFPTQDEEEQMESDWDNFFKQWDEIKAPSYVPKPHIKELLQLDEEQVEWNKREQFLDTEFNKIDEEISAEFNKFISANKIEVVQLPNIPKISKRYITIPWIPTQSLLNETNKLSS